MDAPGGATLLLKRGWKLPGAPPAPLSVLRIPPGHFLAGSRLRSHPGSSLVAVSVVRLLSLSLLLLPLSTPSPPSVFFPFLRSRASEPVATAPLAPEVQGHWLVRPPVPGWRRQRQHMLPSRTGLAAPARHRDPAR
ncbi:hypothetical protein NDU88_002331 [Pleurodeles waltl]|uniref:Uncharacterized protein n=1 Tax=Pleurodeles waltl TaxID=8319 RepID=A0AAV7TK84_PLEWA|nr:hypothetical protein NDU88_002331 [Pleurodeles waltl]